MSYGILHLNLLRVWFDMIECREKKEEYRKVTPYWCARLLLYKGQHKSRSWWTDYLSVLKGEYDGVTKILEDIQADNISFKRFDEIEFANGYKKDRDKFWAKHGLISIDSGKEEWGAEPLTFYFVIEIDNVWKY